MKQLKDIKPTDIQPAAKNRRSLIPYKPTDDPAMIERYLDFYSDRYQLHGFDDRNRWNLKVIARWTAIHLAKQTERGLFIHGACGRGKSHAVRILAKLRGIRLIYAREACQQFQDDDTKGRRDFWEWVNGPANLDVTFDSGLIIDDMGAEPTLNNWGTKREVLDEIIDSRIVELERYGSLTVITSNLGPKEIRARYGDRCMSRIEELCHVVEFTGPDQRKPTEESR